MDAVIMVILRDIQNECYRQIAIERKGGRAIKEEELEPYPQKIDFQIEYQNLAELVSSEKNDEPQITIEEAVQNASQEESSSQKKRSVGCGWLNAYFSAVREWHFVKREKQYKYECAKKQAEDRTYGFEHIAVFIDEYIKRCDKNEVCSDQRIL